MMLLTIPLTSPFRLGTRLPEFPLLRAISLPASFHEACRFDLCESVLSVANTIRLWSGGSRAGTFKATGEMLPEFPGRI